MKLPILIAVSVLTLIATDLRGQSPTTPPPSTPAPVPLIVFSTPAPTATPAPRVVITAHATTVQTNAALAALAQYVQQLPAGTVIHEIHIYISTKDGSSNISIR